MKDKKRGKIRVTGFEISGGIGASYPWNVPARTSKSFVLIFFRPFSWKVLL